MLENIVRHIENGDDADGGRAERRGRNRLHHHFDHAVAVAVFIPLLLMGGMIGRLFREFAVTLTVTIVVSAVVSLTLTPMMCALLPASQAGRRARPPLPWSRAGLRRLIAGYARGLDVVLRHRFVTLSGHALDRRRHRLLYVVIPKGFFPQQDTGLIFGIVRGGAGHLLRSDGPAHRSRSHIVLDDPAVATSSAIRSGRAVRPRRSNRAACSSR